MANQSVAQGAVANRTAPWFWFLISVAGVILMTSLGPAEKSLGANVRVVYLHGAWVWTALAGFTAAGLVGAVGLITHKESLMMWSSSFGRTGLIFWITYLPISLWAMQANWNGLFLAEPRWRLAAVFAVTGLLLQVGLFLIRRPAADAWGNLVFAGVLLFLLSSTDNIMHPSSPIFTSNSGTIKIYFLLLLVLTLSAAWQVARMLHQKRF